MALQSGVWELFLSHSMRLQHTHLVFILSDRGFISLLEFTHSLAVALNYKAVIKAGARMSFHVVFCFLGNLIQS